MRIKFKSPDPRAGTVAQLDSHRGQQLIDSGAAVLVKDEEGAAPPAANTATPAEKTIAAAKAARKTVNGKK